MHICAANQYQVTGCILENIYARHIIKYNTNITIQQQLELE